MNGLGVFKLRDCISSDAQVGLPDGRWVRAVPEPFDSFRTRLTAAREVLFGRAVAMRWPEPGELEAALSRSALAPKEG